MADLAVRLRKLFLDRPWAGTGGCHMLSFVYIIAVVFNCLFKLCIRLNELFL